MRYPSGCEKEKEKNQLVTINLTKQVTLYDMHQKNCISLGHIHPADESRSDLNAVWQNYEEA